MGNSVNPTIKIILAQVYLKSNYISMVALYVKIINGF